MNEYLDFGCHSGIHIILYIYYSHLKYWLYFELVDKKHRGQDQCAIEINANMD